MSEQKSLLDLFEQQFTASFTPKPLERLERSEAVERLELNPFRKQFGSCCGQENVRVFWCHRCGKTPGCWECFLKHKC